MKEVLPGFTRLRTLDLTMSQLGAAGASAIASVLKTMQISSLECVAQPRTLPQWLLVEVRRHTPECSLSCQRPLTRLLSHHSRSAPRSQSLLQQHRARGRLRARCRAQGDADRRTQVCRRPEYPFCVSAPWHACSSPLTWQSLRQRRRREGCHCDCCRPQRDKDHQTQVCRRPIRSLSCQRPLTLLTHTHTATLPCLQPARQ